MTSRVGVIAVVPAAGRSSRFGSMKLFADVEGVPLIERTLRSLIDANVDRIVLVVAPDQDLYRVGLVADARILLATNPDPTRGMFSSIQVGLAAADADVLLVLPADMPFVPASVIQEVADACRASGTVTVPAYGGRRGHPVAIPGRYCSEILAVPATLNLKAALGEIVGTAPIEVTVDSSGILRDVDIPADLGPLPD